MSLMNNMDPEVLSSLIENGTTLATLIGSGTVTAITAKIQGLKGEKSVEKVRNEYDEIINTILQERSDAIMLAQSYKAELDKIEISDEDIEHLQNTVSNVLDIVKKLSPETPIETYETIKDLISVDTLKTMQLLGFNYKKAIGEPLTEICANALNNWANRKSKTNQANKKRN